MGCVVDIGRELGFGSRATVFKAATSEGIPIALKIFHEKRFCRNELVAYEHIQQLGISCDYLPHYHGLMRLTQDQLQNISKRTATKIYKAAIGLERLHGSRLDRVIREMSADELEKTEKTMIAAIVDLHRRIGLCHRDIKADNILMKRRGPTTSPEFVFIDLSEAILQKNTCVMKWKRECQSDVHALREIFQEARSIQAANFGLELLRTSSSTLTSPPLKTNLVPNTSDIVNDDIQRKLSVLLDTAKSAYTMTNLATEIINMIQHPIRPLALALARVLRSVSQLSQALRIVDGSIAAGIEKSDTISIHWLEFNKAKILQALGSDCLQYFSSALAGFEKYLGVGHITTLSCRYELALHYVWSNDIASAKACLNYLATALHEKASRIKKEDRLLRAVLQKMRNPKRLGGPSNYVSESCLDTNSAIQPILLEESRSKKRAHDGIDVDESTLRPAKHPEKSEYVAQK